MLYPLLTLTHTPQFLIGFYQTTSARCIGAFLTSIILSLLLGNTFINLLKKRFLTRVSDRPPKRHLEKNDTPNMGGLFILTIALTTMLLWNNFASKEVWLFIACFLLFGLIGFIDDWAKVQRIAGMTAKVKFSLQMLFSFCIMATWYWWCAPNTALSIPFFKDICINLGPLLIPWGMFVMIGTSNAVNLTDGLDGLATGTLIFNVATFSFIAYLAGHSVIAHYLQIPYAASSEVTVIGAGLIGTLLGFLWFNTHQALIFMGDVGSLSLGAGLAFITLLCRQELLLPIAGGVFVAETMSVILQLTSLRLRGKRLFKMSPIHHHFELIGWNESKITTRFWIITIILCVLALLTLKF